KRKVNHLASSEDVAQLHARSFHLNLSRLDRHRLGHCTDFQLDLKHIYLVKTQMNVASLKGPEPALLCSHAVGRRSGKLKELVAAVPSGLYRLQDPGLNVCRRNFSADDHRAARVCDHASDMCIKFV